MAARRVKSQQGLVCHGHSRPIVELDYSRVTPDGVFLTSASKDGQPMLRNGSTGDWIGTFQGHKGAVWACVLNETAFLAATGSADFSAKVWDALTGAEKHSFQHKHIVRTVRFARQQPLLLTAGYEQILRLYNLDRPEAAPRELQRTPDKVRCAAWHENDSLLLTSYIDKPNISVWDVRSGEEARVLETPKPVTSIELQPDGSQMTTADGKTIRVWDGAKLAQTAALEQKTLVESASLCPKKGRLAWGGEDMWVHFCDAASGEELEVNKGHHGPVHTVRFAPEGESYATGSEDGTIRIWESDYLTRNES